MDNKDTPCTAALGRGLTAPECPPSDALRELVRVAVSDPGNAHAVQAAARALVKALEGNADPACAGLRDAVQRECLKRMRPGELPVDVRTVVGDWAPQVDLRRWLDLPGPPPTLREALRRHGWFRTSNRLHCRAYEPWFPRPAAAIRDVVAAAPTVLVHLPEFDPVFVPAARLLRDALGGPPLPPIVHSLVVQGGRAPARSVIAGHWDELIVALCCKTAPPACNRPTQLALYDVDVDLPPTHSRAKVVTDAFDRAAPPNADRWWLGMPQGYNSRCLSTLVLDGLGCRTLEPDTPGYALDAAMGRFWSTVLERYWTRRDGGTIVVRLAARAGEHAYPESPYTALAASIRDHPDPLPAINLHAGPLPTGMALRALCQAPSVCLWATLTDHIVRKSWGEATAAAAPGPHTPPCAVDLPVRSLLGLPSNPTEVVARRRAQLRHLLGDGTERPQRLTLRLTSADCRAEGGDAAGALPEFVEWAVAACPALKTVEVVCENVWDDLPATDPTVRGLATALRPAVGPPVVTLRVIGLCRGNGHRRPLNQPGNPSVHWLVESDGGLVTRVDEWEQRRLWPFPPATRLLAE